jgi:HD superfamily phosphohydrolase
MAYLDPLYGQVAFDEDMSSLISAPIMQRLRHVRLSNIDSIAMPGIANLSRYEHVLGVGYLAQQLTIMRSVPQLHRIAIGAAALLHDWAITAFGHLVEEGFRYAGVNFRHEDELHAILSGASTGSNVGGAELQILSGRPTRLTEWAARSVGYERADELLEMIQLTIRGEGPYGPLISGTMDLDNVDNVVRMAFHMGLEVDRQLPLRLVRAITTVEGSELAFHTSATPDIEAWVDIRRQVYELLMPAQPDFSYKTMIVAATTFAIEAGDISVGDWHLTDQAFLCRLAASTNEEVRELVGRWTAGESWECTPLWWVIGEKPKAREMREISRELSVATGRPCFAYGIKDKRQRRLSFRFEGGTTRIFGQQPTSWLLGVTSSKRAAFSRQSIDMIMSLAEAKFGSPKNQWQIIGPVPEPNEPTLL